MGGHDVTMTGDVINDGRQIYFTPTSGGKPSLYGGPLSSTWAYVFDHLEFKFGLTATTGSEHTLDGKQYAMEIQLVFWDQSAHIDATAAGASSNADAVVALSYFVETDGTTDNSALASIITAVEDEATLRPVDAATTGNAQEIASKTLKLKDLLGDIDTVKDYYYYAGSQTSSTCKQNVKWIIATDSSGPVASSFVAPNFRAVTGHSIDVMYRKDETKKSETYEEAATILGSTLLGIGTFGTVLNLLQQDAT